MAILTRASCALAVLAALASCSLTDDGVEGIDTLRGISQQLRQGNERPEPLSQTVISQTVSQVESPLKFIEITSRGGQAIVAPIQSSGEYTTYGSSAGQNVVFRHGMPVQSRGFGGDLMSSDEDALLALLRARQRGTADYVMRYLSGDNDTITYVYTCNVLPQGATGYAAGAVRADATEVEVHCVSETGPDFVSEYTVDGTGEILAGRQWFGGLTDYLVFSTLRRD
ncbi:YjbF family lipoprotein [Roseivivax sediminis]|uniref:Group 4 capsule polysaccharide lipoprotein gfcB, YjbF n=1 Tax=Roseivivax sediminis TaxID=936889 RepID=A0A1I1U7U2_9RHOB|nr:YjbF family lipoprotein [Roseivivax sediminis]SFD66847.1 Group 4 capsule polysaccharide lipoprotein gfcB, YjbF [Roseivivax sediminis]